MRMIGRFFGFVFATGAILFVIGAVASAVAITLAGTWAVPTFFAVVAVSAFAERKGAC